MEINVTKKEYRALLTILEIANWVMHAHKTEEPKDTQVYRDFEQKIFALAKEFDCEHLIVYDSNLKRFFPTREFEETSPGMEYVEEFENDSFWAELIHRLVERDVVRQFGEKAFLDLDLMERFKQEEPYERKYAEEFEANGIERLEIVEQHKSSAY